MKVRKLLRNILDGKNLFFLSFMLASAVVLFAGRSVSISQIWKGYRVLYVPVSVSEESVLATLTEAGCRGVISRAAQRIPLSSKFFGSIINPSSYLEDRLGYFRDADGDYNLFYIPDSYEKESELVVSRLVRDQHLDAGLDAKESYPFLVPVVVLALYVFLFVISLKRPYFALPALFPLLLSFSRPFFPVACGCCFFLFAVFLANRIWGRKGALASIFSNFYVDILLLLSLVLFLSQSPSCLWAALLALAASACAILFLRELKAIKDRNSSFTYSLIFTARQIPILYPRTARYLLCLAIPIFALLLLFIFSTKFSKSVSASGILMPSPIQSQSSSGNADGLPLDGAVLPTAEDYFRWAWGVISYPYINLNGFQASPSVKEGDTLVLPRYEEDSKGITRKDEVVLTYGKSFRKDMEKIASSLDYPSIEGFLSKQDRNALVMYSASMQPSGKRSDIFNLTAIILSLCVPLMLCTLFYSFNRSRS